MGRNRTEVVVNFAWFAKCNLSLQYETVCTISVNSVGEKKCETLHFVSIYLYSPVIFGHPMQVFTEILGGLNCRNK